MDTLTGFALPRLFIKQLGESQSIKETQGHLDRGYDILEQAIQQACTPAELLALVAEGVS